MHDPMLRGAITRSSLLETLQEMQLFSSPEMQV